MKKKKVYVAYTGGTIGMKPSKKGFVPESGYFTELISSLPEFLSPELLSPELLSPEFPSVEMNEYDNLIDSSNITPDDWFRIALDIQARIDDYDGFVVLHGTDTMAYTASALSFMLSNLSKPVIVTGSQIPWSQMRTDARDNFVTSLLLAANYDIPEVGLYFHNRLYRGNRARKLDSTGFHAFQSPNFPAIAEVGTRIKVNHELIMPAPIKAFAVQKISQPKVMILSLFPGFPASLLESVLAADVSGLVLMTYGMGNAPCNDKHLLSILKRASDRGLIVVNCTQCYKGTVDMSGYATGQGLLEAGLISGFDMTPEATLTKLSYLLSGGGTIDSIKADMQTNLRGELTQ